MLHLTFPWRLLEDEPTPTTRLYPFIFFHILSNWLKKSNSHSQTLQRLWRWNLSKWYCLLLLPKGNSMILKQSNGAFPHQTPFGQLHLHSLPKSFTSLSSDAAADARHWSRKRAAVSITPLLYYPPQSAFFCSPLPHCWNKETSRSNFCALHFISLQVYLIWTPGFFWRPSLLFPSGSLRSPWSPRGAAPGLCAPCGGRWGHAAHSQDVPSFPPWTRL